MNINLHSLTNFYDVVIVGGGINGVGIARDCALRGISCLLVEKGDFSAGTSGASSGMIHGGPRYMLSNIGVTKLACLDSGYIQKTAPHLLFRIPFLYPVYHKGKSKWTTRLYLEAVEAFFSAYDQFVPLKNGKKHTRLSPQEVIALEPNIPQEDLAGGVTFDEWGIDVARLCVINAVDAVENGAVVLNHTKVTSVNQEKNRVTGITLKDTITGEEKTLSCRILVNATGPWSPHFAKLFGGRIQLRGGKGIHITFDRRLFNMAIVSQAIDGRELFIMPYENTTILGTTDDDYFGDLDDQRCLDDEISYLLEAIEPVFPAIRQARMTAAWSGVRPTLYGRGQYESDLSREHKIVDHAQADGIEGVVSLIGGKLASYRIMAEETTDWIAAKLAVNQACQTHVRALPGGDSLPNTVELSQAYALDPYTVSRLVYRHGSRALRILDAIKDNPEQGALVCSCEPVTYAEIDYVIQNEMARTVSDVRRRTRLTQGPCQGTDCLIAGSAFFPNAPHTASSYWREWWYNRALVLNSDQLKQEEISQAIHFANNSLNIA